MDKKYQAVFVVDLYEFMDFWITIHKDCIVKDNFRGYTEAQKRIDFLKGIYKVERKNKNHGRL